MATQPLPRILHVDDDDDIRMVSLIALKVVGGLDVTQCASGPEALEVAASVKPDLFLLDAMMPGMSGEETLLALRKLPGFATTPAIFMTAKSRQSDAERLMELGALAVIVKPFEAATLASKIVEIWSSRPGN